MMSFGGSVGDLVAIAEFTVKVCKAYKGAPSDYQNIAKDVVPFQSLINRATVHSKSTTLGGDDQQQGQETLESCRILLEDLNLLVEKYKSLASTNKRLFFKRLKFIAEDTATLRARLTLNTTLLSSFIRRFDIYYPYLYYIY